MRDGKLVLSQSQVQKSMREANAPQKARNEAEKAEALV